MQITRQVTATSGLPMVGGAELCCGIVAEVPVDDARGHTGTCTVRLYGTCTLNLKTTHSFTYIPRTHAGHYQHRETSQTIHHIQPNAEPSPAHGTCRHITKQRPCHLGGRVKRSERTKSKVVTSAPAPGSSRRKASIETMLYFCLESEQIRFAEFFQPRF